VTKKKETATAPMLRFPEFAGQAQHEVRLSEVTSESKIRNGNRLPAGTVMGVSKVLGIIPMQARVVSSDISRYKVVKKSWFAYNPMRLNIGSIARWDGNADILVSPDYIVFRCLDDHRYGLSPDYLEHFRQSDLWNAFVGEGGDGGVRIRIYYQDLARLELVLPLRAEQQKIADFLTSLDKLILVQAQKVEALIKYKRGLMQQLFPREGETVPRLRFSEFRDAPVWKEKKLSTAIELLSGIHLSPDEYSSVGDIPYFTGPSDFTSDVKQVKKWTREGVKSAKAQDILITVKGSGVGALWYLDMPLVAMGRQLMAVRAKGCSSRFLFQFLLMKRSRFEDLGAGNLIPGLARGDILNIVAFFPEDNEQIKIADCLFNLDDRILDESEQLKILRTRKIGLMQKIFPVPEEIQV
jgi:type I restriction enzyme S subunit